MKRRFIPSELFLNRQYGVNSHATVAQQNKRVNSLKFCHFLLHQ